MSAVVAEMIDTPVYDEYVGGDVLLRGKFYKPASSEVDDALSAVHNTSGFRDFINARIASASDPRNNIDSTVVFSEIRSKYGL